MAGQRNQQSEKFCLRITHTPTTRAEKQPKIIEQNSRPICRLALGKIRKKGSTILCEAPSGLWQNYLENTF